MRISEALQGVDLVEVLEPTSSTIEGKVATGVQYDSRRVTPGDIFVAMRGNGTDGNLYLAAALEQGAVAVVTDSRETWQAGLNVPVALVPNGRRALARIAANLFGHPEQRLKTSAITGTNGKTTTAFLLEQLLRAAGRTCILIGTVETHIGDRVLPSVHTTPEASDLLAIFAQGIVAGATDAVMEISSHALDQERVWGVPVDTAIFTNLTRDHLDYHGSMDAYADAKARLFAGVGTSPPRVAILNADDPHAGRMLQAAGHCPTLWTYSLEIEQASFYAGAVEINAQGSAFQLCTPFGEAFVESPLAGRVNVYNLVAAIAGALARGVPLAHILGAIKHLEPAPGRFQMVPNQRGFSVIVDYAHTDDALTNLIGLARQMVLPTAGRVITVFGCGGDRDRGKRPRMGRAAGEGSDLVILTSDNPRTEDPAGILAEALAGVQETPARCMVEPDRGAAIRLALGEARAGDIVLLAGKGHERFQIVGDRTIPFDDVAVAAAILAEAQ